MTKHYILKLDPESPHDWDRCTVRDPITANRPDLANLIAEAVGEAPGSYLIAIDIDVKVLERVPGVASPLTLNPDQPTLLPQQRVQLPELVA